MLKINEDFAKNYNAYRQKEEFQKLKARYGDVKLKKSSTDPAIASDDDSSSDDSGSDSSWADKEQEDFLVLYDALCRNDPALDDANKVWFRDPSPSSDDKDEPDQDEPTSHDPNEHDELNNTLISNDLTNNESPVKKHKHKKSHKELKLRDYEREFLVEHGGVEDETMATEANRIAGTESEHLLEQMKQSAGNLEKEVFLRESEAALQEAGISETKASGTLDFLKKRDVKDVKKSKRHKKGDIDINKLSFVDTGNEEADKFLRDFIVNQRWRNPASKSKNHIPTYNEVIGNANLEKAQPETNQNLLGDDEILDDDDEFLVKVNQMEEKRLANIMGEEPVMTNSFKPVKFRFEEEDKEFIKSYPRRIESSIHQAKGEKSTRALKREAHAERKLKAKQAKIEEISRLRKLKLAMLGDKIERIKRSCGPGLCLAIDSTDDLEHIDDETDPDGAEKPSKQIDAMDVAMHLDEDWDPEEHDRFVKRMFDDTNYDEAAEDQEPPQFSDDSDLDVPSMRKLEMNEQIEDEPSSVVDQDEHPESTETQKSGRRRRKKHKHVIDSDDLDFEDIIPGATKDEDIVCRFRYRKVTPNDFGLSIEDILTADVKELNKWVPMSRITGYRTQEEEERDVRRYHSNAMQHKKTRVLQSLSNPNATWYPSEDGENKEQPTKKRKRNRKKKNRTNALLDTVNATNEETVHDDSTLVDKSNMSSDVIEQSSSNTKHKMDKPKSDPQSTKKFKTMFISDARLEAAGITRKDYYRAMNKERHKT